MVQLQDPVGHCQPNAASSDLRCKVQIEDLVPDFVRNSDALIGNAQHAEYVAGYAPPPPVPFGFPVLA